LFYKLVSEENLSIDGVFVENKSFQQFIDEISKDHIIFHLDEKGQLFWKIAETLYLDRRANVLFVLGSNIDLCDEYVKYLASKNAIKISLGKISYLASQCISLIHTLIRLLFIENKKII